MDKEFIYEILYGVFVKDTNAFTSFITEEIIMSYKANNKSERERIMNEIDKQFMHIFFKIIKEEDARNASSHLDILLKLYKEVFND